MDHQIFAQLLGNYGEFVGAVGVVITLGYLAVQIKQNRTQTQSQIEQSLYEQWQTPAKIMADSPQLADLFCRGQKSRSALTEAERMQFDMFCSLGINTWSLPFAFLKTQTPTQTGQPGYPLPNFFSTAQVVESFGTNAEIYFSQAFKNGSKDIWTSPYHLTICHLKSNQHDW